MNENLAAKAIRVGSFHEYTSYINSVNVNFTNEFGHSFLHEAILMDRIEIVKDLIERGINVNLQDLTGKTVLHYIGIYGNFELAKIILNNNGNVNIPDEHGNNALWTAVFNARGYYKIVELYVKFGGAADNKNNYGKSALDFAIQINDNNLISILVSKG